MEYFLFEKTFIKLLFKSITKMQCMGVGGGAGGGLEKILPTPMMQSALFQVETLTHCSKFSTINVYYNCKSLEILTLCFWIA